jgi:hypothetical protein
MASLVLKHKAIIEKSVVCSLLRCGLSGVGFLLPNQGLLAGQVQMKYHRPFQGPVSRDVLKLSKDRHRGQDES